AFFLGKDLLVLDDGRILVLVNTATAGPTPIYLCGFLPDGTPDAGFGTNGTTIIEVFPVFANGRGLAVQDSCRALIAGLRGYPNDQNALVAAIQLDSCGMISTGFPTAAYTAFQLYPNPSTGEVHIQLNGTGPGPREWEVLDLAGRVVLRGRLDGGHAVFRAEVSPGTYAVRMRTGSEVRTQLLQLVR
ncbi:MAG: T9SS type A sorting domain-containing protein, partial [Flavobacteriales bacterium]|nr:T9SS type A sorting domain-containing protein [Flavobacteriales bacterium]MCB0784311.1 T9SS type A sorting domain-containing protein [Flavobacteriales bacterium]